MKHLGLYNRDNTQRSENLSLQVVLVGRRRMSETSPAPARPRSTPGPVSARGLEADEARPYQLLVR